MSSKTLKPVVSQPGRPLYLTVKEHVKEAIDAGVFRPGEQMPSTKQLSEKLEVSLVTAHRALQELVDNGVLYRAQGKGTFVHDRYLDRSRSLTNWRVGVLLHHELRVSDVYHGSILDGVRHASQNLGVELLMMRVADDIRRECHGFLTIDASGDDTEQFASRLTRRQPMLTLGAPPVIRGGASVRVDLIELLGRALEYLRGLGHEQIGFIGGHDRIASQRDRWLSYEEACTDLQIAIDPEITCRGLEGRSTDRDQSPIVRMIAGPRRPTAIIAAGYGYALEAYSAAATVGIRIPEDLSVIGLDDPLSAGLLAPALTTLRQPLSQMGQAAITILCEHLQHPEGSLPSRMLKGELIVRRSCASARK